MDTEREILLREWEQRYESYRAYTREYMAGVTIAVTGTAVAMSLALGLNVIHILRVLILILIMVFVSAFLLGHRIVIDGFTRLGNRITTLENKLGMEKFATITPVVRVARAVAIGSIVIWLGILGITIYVTVTGF